MRIFNTIPSPTISYIDLGPVRVHFYALVILLGIILAVWMSAVRMRQRGGQAGLIVDITIWAVPLGIIGGRFYHVVTHLNDYFAPGVDWTSIFRIWEGGLAIYGALIFGAAGALIGCRFAGVRFWSFVDILAPGLLLAQALGRWGNYFNNELYGTPTDLPWALEIPVSNPAYPSGLPDGVTFHPTFLYESIWSLIGVGLLLLIDRKFSLRWGKLFAIYLIYYSIGRIWIENIRIDPSDVFLGLRTNVWSAVLGIAAGVVIFVLQNRSHPGMEIDVYLPGRKPDEPVAPTDDEVDFSTADEAPESAEKAGSEVDSKVK